MLRSISAKLLTITIGVISVAVVSSGAVLLRQQHREFYRGFEEGSVVLARTVAEHCVAALVFGDNAGATEILSKLEKSTEVARAILFDSDGAPMAAYTRPGSEPSAVPIRNVAAREHRDGYLHVFEPVSHRGVQQGTLYLAAASGGLRARVSEATTTVVLAGLTAILVAAVLAWLLQRSLTRPILRLAETMGRINDPTMISPRVSHVSRDEIGVLYRGFYRMLDQLAAGEQERDRSGARLRALIAALPDPVFVLEANGNIAEVLAGRPEALTLPAAELRGRPITGLIGIGPEANFAHAITTALATGTPQRLAYELDLANGKRWFDAVLVPIAEHHDARGGERVVLFVPRDVTERHTLELDLRQAQKMEALGRLAGGVAHDFNNILTAIMGYGSLLAGRVDPGGKAMPELTEILKAAERAAMLTQQLLAFSRRQVVAFRHVFLNDLVGDMQRMLERIIGEDVILVADLASDVPPVHFDPSQLQQVILNLAVNAREAMPNGGTLTLSTSSVMLRTRRAGDPELMPGRYALLKVTDTGVGMEEAVRARIFEPFFTTKGRMGGTGLGLAMVYGIVRQAGGDVGVVSEPSRGATFSIFLPEASVESRATTDEASQLRDIQRGNETVLVVEDEPQLLDLTCRMLREQGYQVLRASDARQALQICSMHPGVIHLMVTDVVMPKMGGGELVQAVLPLRPRMRALYMSGYTDGTAVHHGVAVGQVPFLQKPFTPLELAARVREALGELPELRDASDSAATIRSISGS